MIPFLLPGALNIDIGQVAALCEVIGIMAHYDEIDKSLDSFAGRRSPWSSPGEEVDKCAICLGVLSLGEDLGEKYLD